MRKLMLLLSALFLLIATTAMATQFDFSYSGANISGYGLLDASDNGNGSFTVWDGSSTVFVSGVDQGSFTLTPNPNAPNSATSPLGLFYYDNQYFSKSNPLLDSAGLLFTNHTTNVELNIWGNGPDTLYSAYLGANGGYPSQNNDVTFNAAPVPEPSTFLLFGVGLAGAAFFRKRMKK